MPPYCGPTTSTSAGWVGDGAGAVTVAAGAVTIVVAGAGAGAVTVVGAGVCSGAAQAATKVMTNTNPSVINNPFFFTSLPPSTRIL